MEYQLEFTRKAEKDIALHQKSDNKVILNKLLKLLEELTEHPTTGTGKPERLKHFTPPIWSRRISQKHRLVYEIQEERIIVLVLSAYGHYDDR